MSDSDSKSIVAIMADTVQGDKGFGSILGAWVPNTIRTLQAADPMALQISGPKVNSFMHNLRGA